MLGFLKRKRSKPKALEYSLLCSMLHFSTGDMVRCLKFGSIFPPWQKIVTGAGSVHPAPQVQTNILDLVHIDGGLNEVWTPSSRLAVSESTLHVLVNFTVSFTLTESLDVDRIKATLEGTMNVRFTDTVPFLRMEWTLWDQGLLPAGKRYEFEVVAEIPATAPCSLETKLASIDYNFVLWVEGLRDRCLGQRIVSKAIGVVNPYLVFDIPRVDPACSTDDDTEMIGATFDVNKDTMAFVRCPDQFVAGREFPMEISFPLCREGNLRPIKSISISIIQKYIFIIPIEGTKKRITEKTPVSEVLYILPSTQVTRLSVRFSGGLLGRFTTPRFRICHALRIVFHRGMGRRKIKWEIDIEIFQPNAEPDVLSDREREIQIRRLSGRDQIQEVDGNKQAMTEKKAQ